MKQKISIIQTFLDNSFFEKRNTVHSLFKQIVKIVDYSAKLNRFNSVCYDFSYTLLNT